MNKTLLLVLAICLSVHAFVKREAPEGTAVEKLGKSFTEGFNDIKEQVEKAFNRETLEKNFSEFVQGFNKAVDSLKSKDSPKT